MKRWCLALILAAAVTQAGGSQKPPDVNVGNVGPKVGDIAPDFQAPDQHGVPRRLSALLGVKGAMLVFYRSAEW